MEGRKGFKLIIEIVVGMIFILMVFFFLGVCSGGEIIDVGLFVMMFVFFLFFGVFVFFLLVVILRSMDIGGKILSGFM